MRRILTTIAKSSSRWRVVAAAALCAGLAAACSTQKPSTGEPAKKSSHAAHSERLRGVMRSFNAAARERIPGEIDAHDRWEGVLVGMAEAARDVQVSAMGLAAAPPSGLDAAEASRFEELANDLGRKAAVLELDAARGDVDGVELARTQVAEACEACHAGFRLSAPGIPAAFE